MRLSLRARLLVIPAVVVIFAVTLLTVLESRSQRAWIIQREASGLTRLVHEAARTASVELGGWQPAVDSLDARHGVRATGLLGDSELQELLRNGFPAAMRFRLELWREGGMFDEIEGAVQWNTLVRYDPYTGQYLVVRSQGARFAEDFGGFPTLAAAEAAVLEKPYEVRLQPTRLNAAYYYNVVVDVESLSVSDLDELQRWLRGELQPAVRGRRSPLSALRKNPWPSPAA